MPVGIPARWVRALQVSPTSRSPHPIGYSTDNPGLRLMPDTVSNSLKPRRVLGRSGVIPNLPTMLTTLLSATSKPKGQAPPQITHLVTQRGTATWLIRYILRPSTHETVTT